MAIKIYVDVLFFTNLVFDYILLIFTATFTKNKTSSIRLFLAATIGAVFAVIIFFLIKSQALAYVLQFFLLQIMIYIAFSRKKNLERLGISFTFYLCAFALGGMITAFSGTKIVTSSGIPYVDIGIFRLLAIGALAYFVSDIGFGLVGSKKRIVPLGTEIYISQDGLTKKFLGFCDSGNLARDIDGAGVAFASRRSVYDLYEKSPYKGSVIVKTVGGESSLPSFLPSEVYYFKDKNKVAKNCKVAIFDGEISNGYDLILPCDFFGNI